MSHNLPPSTWYGVPADRHPRGCAASETIASLFPEIHSNRRRVTVIAAALLTIALEHGFDIRRGHLDVDAGALFLQEHRHARVARAPAAVEAFRQFRVGEVGDAH